MACLDFSCVYVCMCEFTDYFSVFFCGNALHSAKKVNKTCSKFNVSVTAKRKENTAHSFYAFLLVYVCMRVYESLVMRIITIVRICCLSNRRVKVGLFVCLCFFVN